MKEIKEILYEKDEVTGGGEAEETTVIKEIDGEEYAEIEDTEKDEETQDADEGQEAEAEGPEETAEEQQPDREAELLETTRDLKEEVNALRDTVKGMTQSKEELKDILTSADLKEAVEKQTDKVYSLDRDIDEEAWKKENRVLEALKQDYNDKYLQEQFDKRVNSSDNLRIADEYKGELQKAGMEISNADFESLTERAKEHSATGRLDENSYAKAFIDQYGAAKYQAFHKISGEQKARKDIATAQGKDQDRLKTGTTGSNKKLIKTSEISTLREAHNVAAQMDDKELYEGT